MKADTPERSSRLARVAPIVAWLPSYQRSWWRPDLLAGLTVWALLVPEAMAYAELAGMPPETGLYAGLGAIIGYAIFGRSRQMFAGPSSTIAVLSAATVAAAAEGPEDFIVLSVALALMVGLLYVVFGLLRLGFVSVFMSKPVLTGFTFGLGLTIAIGQLPKMFGVEGGDGSFFEQLWVLLGELVHLDPLTTVIGVAALVILLVGKRLFGHAVPMALIVVIGAIILSNLLKWHEQGVHVVGEIPAALPSIALPGAGLSGILQLIPGAIGIVLIGFAESYGIAQNFARKHDYSIDANQELIAVGAANVGSGLFGGFAVDGSLSRSAAADDAGAKSQMAMLICGLITVVTILFLTPLFEQLPEAVLAAIVVSAVVGTFNVAEMRRIWRSNRRDFIAALTALLGVCAVDILWGLLLAVMVSFTLLIYRASRPNMPELGLLQDPPVYAPLASNPGAVPPRDVVVLRFDAMLFFANAEEFEGRIDQIVHRKNPPKGIVADFEGVNLIDTDGAAALASVAADLAARDIAFAIARLGRNGHDALERAEVYEQIGADRFFDSVRQAVEEAQRQIKADTP